jgi:hypothetical protein
MADAILDLQRMQRCRRDAPVHAARAERPGGSPGARRGMRKFRVARPERDEIEADTPGQWCMCLLRDNNMRSRAVGA